MEIGQSRRFLLLEIDGEDAEIPEEQKPLLFINGFIFVQPHEFWSKLLPSIDFSVEGHSQIKLENFIRSKTLIPIIIEMNNTRDVLAFNEKWVGKVLEEEIEQVTKFYAEDQLDHFTV